MLDQKQKIEIIDRLSNIQDSKGALIKDRLEFLHHYDVDAKASWDIGDVTGKELDVTIYAHHPMPSNWSDIITIYNIKFSESK